jgi:hypothetical protein
MGTAPIIKETIMYQDHTLPWRVVPAGKTPEGEDTHDEDGNLVIAPYRGRHIVTASKVPVCEFVHDEDDARRIAGCVNACKGIPTEALECQTKKQLTSVVIERTKMLARQNDKLLHSLKELLFLYAAEMGDKMSASERVVVDRAKSIIAEVERGAS